MLEKALLIPVGTMEVGFEGLVMNPKLKLLTKLTHQQWLTEFCAIR